MGLGGDAVALVGAGDWHEVKVVDTRANARAEYVVVVFMGIYTGGRHAFLRMPGVGTMVDPCDSSKVRDGALEILIIAQSAW